MVLHIQISLEHKLQESRNLILFTTAAPGLVSVLSTKSRFNTYLLNGWMNIFIMPSDLIFPFRQRLAPFLTQSPHIQILHLSYPKKCPVWLKAFSDTTSLPFLNFQSPLSFLSWTLFMGYFITAQISVYRYLLYRQTYILSPLYTVNSLGASSRSFPPQSV